MIELPAAFIDQMRQLLGKEGWQQFAEALQHPAPISIRYNPFKHHQISESMEPVRWSGNGYYLPERPVFTLDPLFQAGTYYVQEAASMFIGQAVQQLTDPGRPLKVLDLCAAPGGKSTDLLSVLPPGSLLVANEVIRTRYAILRQNLSKWGQANIIASNHDSEDFAALEGFFDLILVDAPCSGEGLFRKDHKAIKEWSEDAVALCARRQKRILGNISKALAPGGMLLYSTCTYNRIENDQNAHWLAATLGLQPLSLDISDDWDIETREIGYQFYPHRTQGEGLYFSAFRKEDGPAFKRPKKTGTLDRLSSQQKAALKEWVRNPDDYTFFQPGERASIRVFPRSLEEEMLLVSRALRRSKAGLEIGDFKGKNFVPAHDFALSTIAKGGIPSVELTLKEALKYLKKEAFEGAQIPIGWMQVQYQGQALGWAKGLKNRVNNYFPKGWRIRMEI
jgi:16S rRNA C967 or C1407 C5-methylase (RsmB/RsmF family)/NOL1/NOP2/fmu family ribosome biogenesis protein